MDLHESFAAPLRSFIARRAPAGTDVDDVLQEVFVRIQERLPQLRDAGRIDAWIFQIARNVLADAFRGRRRRFALAERVAAEGEGEARPAAAADDDGAALAELSACLAPMIARLPEAYRAAIELTELGGLTQAEAARRAGLSLSGMKSRVQRGRERLEEIVRASCRIEQDVRGGVTGCEPRPGGCGDRLRPSPGSRDSQT